MMDIGFVPRQTTVTNSGIYIPDKKIIRPGKQKPLFDQSNITQEMRNASKIKKYFSDSIIKDLSFITTSFKIVDNNDRADYIAEVLTPEKFVPIGVGTNRITFQKYGYAYKIALDRRGHVDNFQEFKRSPECEEYFARTYETNHLIAVSEYVTVMERDAFIRNAGPIRDMLEDLSRQYVFSDIGIDSKNYCNLGYRDANANGERQIVFLDYAYMHPIIDNEDALICPACGMPLRYNKDYTSFKCSNVSCNLDFSYIEVRRRMNDSYENIENQFIAELNDLEPPDMHELMSDIQMSSNDPMEVVSEGDAVVHTSTSFIY